MDISNRISKHFPLDQRIKTEFNPVRMTCSGVKYYLKPHEYFNDQYTTGMNQCEKCYWYKIGQIMTDAFKKRGGN